MMGLKGAESLRGAGAGWGKYRKTQGEEPVSPSSQNVLGMGLGAWACLPHRTRASSDMASGLPAHRACSGQGHRLIVLGWILKGGEPE